jgi:hypothetical protein
LKIASARTVEHREAEDRCGAARGGENDALHEDLLVLAPGEAVRLGYWRGAIWKELITHGRRLRERRRLDGRVDAAEQNIVGPIDVAATQNNYARNMATKDVD